MLNFLISYSILIHAETLSFLSDLLDLKVNAKTMFYFFNIDVGHSLVAPREYVPVFNQELF